MFSNYKLFNSLRLGTGSFFINLKTKIMKTIEAKVYRLPIEQAEKCVTIAHKQMMLSPGLVTSGGDIQAYHLYITTDEKIKEGDWYLDTETNEVKQYTKGCV